MLSTSRPLIFVFPRYFLAGVPDAFCLFLRFSAVLKCVFHFVDEFVVWFVCEAAPHFPAHYDEFLLVKLYVHFVANSAKLAQQVDVRVAGERFWYLRRHCTEMTSSQPGTRCSV